MKDLAFALSPGTHNLMTVQNTQVGTHLSNKVLTLNFSDKVPGLDSSSNKVPNSMLIQCDVFLV